MIEDNCLNHHQVVNDGCHLGYIPGAVIKTMGDNYVVSSAVAATKWGKEYKRYRSGLTRLYICMVSLMLFVSLLVVCTVFLFKYSFYLHPSGYELQNGDIREVGVSTLFCQSIVLKAANFNRRVTVVSEVKRYKSSKQSISSDVVLLRRTQYWYRSFYLLKGSVVIMSLSSRHSISVYWLKGRATLNKWIVEMNKALKELHNSLTEEFTRTSMYDTFTIDDDDSYYLGFAPTAGDTEYSEVLVNMTVSRVVYDTSSYKASCNASTGKSCHVQLRFNSHDIALIEVDDLTTNNTTQSYWTVWYCQPRIWVYAVIFGGIFVFGNLILLLIYVCVLSKVKKKLPNQQPSVIPSRAESFNTHGVKLQLMNTTTEISNNLSENDQSTIDEPNEMNSTFVVVARQRPQRPNSDPWITPPSPPRWSTFLREHPFEEELVTNFSQSSPNSPSSSNPDIMHNSEECRFANDLSEHLKMLEADDAFYIGPEETDIDDPYDHYYEPDSELEAFISDNEGNLEDFHEVELQDVVRRREGRREQRWEPRLSMVTEV